MGKSLLNGSSVSLSLKEQAEEERASNALRSRGGQGSELPGKRRGGSDAGQWQAAGPRSQRLGESTAALLGLAARGGWRPRGGCSMEGQGTKPVAAPKGTRRGRNRWPCANTAFSKLSFQERDGKLLRNGQKYRKRSPDKEWPLPHKDWSCP